MLVQDIMQRAVVTVKPGATLSEVSRLLQPRGVRHLPVVEGDSVLGMVSDRDLKRAIASLAMSGDEAGRPGAMDRLRVVDIMTRPAITIGPTFPIEEAGRLMLAERVSALPVTEGERLVGIVTETDVVSAFVRAMGVAEPSTRLDVALPERPGAVGEVARILEETGAAISSLVTLVGPDGRREAVVRVRTMNPGSGVRALERKGYCVREAWRG